MRFDTNPYFVFEVVDLPNATPICCVNLITTIWRTWKANRMTPTYLNTGMHVFSCCCFSFVHHLLLLIMSWNLCYINKARWNINKHQIENHTSPYLDMVIRSTCFWIMQLNTQLLPIVFAIECEVVNSIWRHNPHGGGVTCNFFRNHVR